MKWGSHCDDAIIEPLGHTARLAAGSHLELDVEGADETSYLNVFICAGKVEVYAEGGFTDVVALRDGRPIYDE